MEVMLYIYAGLIALILGFLSLERPYLLVSVLLFMYIYPYNIETPLPLDVRGIIAVYLFGILVVFNKENLDYAVKEIIFNRYTIWFIIFFGVALVYTILSGESYLIQVRNMVLALISLVIGALVVKRKINKWYIFVPIIIVGLVSSIDTLYSTFILGELKVTRLLDLARGSDFLYNHNHPPLRAGFGIIMLLILNAKKQINKPIFLLLLAVLSAGVFFSTSRSALLAVVLTAIIMAYYQPEIKFTLKNALTVFLITAIVLGGFYFGYAQLRSSETGENTFVDKLHERIFEEPLRIFGGDESDEYAEYSGNVVQGTMSWRYQKSLGDLQMFMSQNSSKILFGFGSGNYGEIGGVEFIGNQATQYAAHNGYVLLLIERGFLGLVLFILLFLILSFKMLYQIKNGKNIALPIVYIILILAIFSIGQNSEFLSPINFLFFGIMIAYSTHFRNEEEESEEDETALENIEADFHEHNETHVI